MKRRSVVVPAVFAVLASTALLPAAADNPSFTGKWRPDLRRSTSEKTLKPATDDPNAVAPPAPSPEQAGHPLEVIEQSASTVKITLHDEDGEPTNTLVLTLNGEETSQEMSNGALQYISRARWDGPSLVVEWRMERDGRRVIGGTDVRTLEDPDTQRLVRDIEDAKSRTHSVIVLVKETPAPAAPGTQPHAIADVLLALPRR